MSGVPYPTELKWKVGVKWGGRSEHWVGYPTAPYPTLRSSSGLLNGSRNQMWGGGGKSEHWVGYPTLGGRSEHWVGALLLPWD